MKLGAPIISGLAVALLFSIAVPAVDVTDAGPPPVPPPVITPNGIMSVFGKYQVLFKVAVPPQHGEPATEASHMMSEGEREDDIEVVKIDYDAAMITFNNHGVVQELPLETAKNVGASPAAGTVAPGPARTAAARRAAMRTEPDAEPNAVVVAEHAPAAATASSSGFATISGDNNVNAAKTAKPGPETILSLI